jgi:hypothetical protein
MIFEKTTPFQNPGDAHDSMDSCHLISNYSGIHVLQIIFQNYKYLVDWQGYSLSNASWQPQENLTDDVVAGYEKPSIIDSDRLNSAVVNFHVGFQKRLRFNGSAPFEISCPLDVFRNFFGGKGQPSPLRGYKHYLCEDFSELSLPNNWHYLVDYTGVGRRLVFPVLMKSSLSFTKKNFSRTDDGTIIQDGDQMPVEKIMIRLCTDAFKL